MTFTSNTSNSNTSAVDTLIEQVGVCRDFAHLMIALCRAVNIPARFATGTDYGADPALGPPDFHAYVEAYLGDRWYIFDPSGTAIPMGFVRFGTGRDAADVAFATIFGRRAFASAADPRLGGRGRDTADRAAVPSTRGAVDRQRGRTAAVSRAPAEPRRPGWVRPVSTTSRVTPALPDSTRCSNAPGRRTP